jgi:hypothetical protein
MTNPYVPTSIAVVLLKQKESDSERERERERERISKEGQEGEARAYGAVH